MEAQRDSLMPRILVVDGDDTRTRFLKQCFLADVGFIIDATTKGQCSAHLENENYDLVVLSLDRPSNGIPVIHAIRRTSSIPILVIGPDTDSSIKIALLNAGADDYQVPPLNGGELVARARATIRRDQGHSKPVVRWGDFELHVSQQIVTKRGKRLVLTAMEYRLLEYLALRPNSIVSKAQILRQLYGSTYRDANVIEVYIYGLRKKLKDDSIITVKGQGYFFQVGDDNRSGDSAGLTLNEPTSLPVRALQTPACSTDEKSISGSFSYAIAGALNTDNSAIAVVTKSHRERLLRELRAENVDIDGFIQRGSFILLDVADVLTTLSGDGFADRARFVELFSPLIDTASKAAKAKHPRVAFCCEGIGHLWAENKTDAALGFEEGFTHLANSREVDLMCACFKPENANT